MKLFFTIVFYALQAYYFVLIASILLSWLPEIKKSKIGQFIDQLASPYLRFFRGWIVIGMFDLTTIVGILLFQFGLSMVSQMINMMP